MDSNNLNNKNVEVSQSLSDDPSQQKSTDATSLCVVCSTRNRALVLVPCGHFNVCVPCGHGLAACPNCGANIKALVRIYD